MKEVRQLTEFERGLAREVTSLSTCFVCLATLHTLSGRQDNISSLTNAVTIWFYCSLVLLTRGWKPRALLMATGVGMPLLGYVELFGPAFILLCIALGLAFAWAIAVSIQGHSS